MQAVLFAIGILYSFSAFLVDLMGNLGMRGKQIEGSMLCQCRSEFTRIKPKFMTKTSAQLLRDLKTLLATSMRSYTFSINNGFKYMLKY